MTDAVWDQDSEPTWDKDYALDRLQYSLPYVIDKRPNQSAILFALVNETQIRLKWLHEDEALGILTRALPHFLGWLLEPVEADWFRAIVFFPNDTAYGFMARPPPPN